MQGFGVRTSISLCLSCHNASSVGHDKNYGGKVKHPVFVNVTADAKHRLPTLGYVNGTSSDKTYTHLLNGKQVVCMTCHNTKTKPNDPGRSWEYTTTTDNKTYTLQNGGWTYYAYAKPVVYRTINLQTPPTYIKSQKNYIVSESEYDLDSVNGAVIFHQNQTAGTYVYVTLVNDYLRNTNENNQLCLDCHVTATHKQNDCTVCHATHNSDNLYNIRNSIGGKGVVYATATTMSGSSGVCVVCHTATIYDNSTAIIQQPHYENNECANCHPHRQGFPTYTTVIRGVVGKFLAFIGFNNAYAEEPPPLENYSMGGGEGGMMSFEATATVQTESAQSQSQTITTDVIYYYHNDHLGTPMFMSDETGAKVWQREQMPFGETTLERGTVTENLRLPGQYRDTETGLNQNWYRDYSDNLGRYIEADLIGQRSGPNLFIYTNNSPNNYKDKYGLLPGGGPNAGYEKPSGSEVPLTINDIYSGKCKFARIDGQEDVLISQGVVISPAIWFKVPVLGRVLGDQVKYEYETFKTFIREIYFCNFGCGTFKGIYYATGKDKIKKHFWRRTVYIKPLEISPGWEKMFDTEEYY